MSRFNTGNPIDSDKLEDLSDNAKNMDLATNSIDPTWTDRFGRERPTLAAAVDPSGLVQTAVNAADRAEAAYDAIHNSGALQSASIYETIADGLSGVADDEYFWVYPNSLNSIDNLTLFKRVDATTEELLYVQYNLNAFMIEEGANWETGEL